MSRQAAEVKVLITRSKEGNSLLGSRLMRLGVTPIPFNTLSFSPPRDWRVVDRFLKNLENFDWLLFTSSTGVRYLAERMKTLGLRSVMNRDRPRVAAVGAKTASALRRRKIKVQFVPSKYLTSALGRELPEGFGSRVLILRANIGTAELAEILKERGFEVSAAAIYETDYEEDPIFQQESVLEADLVAFASPSAVGGFCQSVSKEILSILTHNAPAVCIGPVTGRKAQQNGFKVLPLPKEHTIQGLVEEIRRFGGDA